MLGLGWSGTRSPEAPDGSASGWGRMGNTLEAADVSAAAKVPPAGSLPEPLVTKYAVLVDEGNRERYWFHLKRPAATSLWSQQS